MNLVPYNESFLLSQFREFYTEVIRLKRLVKSKGWVSPAETESGNGNGNGGPVDTGTWVYFPEVESVAMGSLPDTGKTQTLAVRSASAKSPNYDFAEQPPSSDQTRMSLLVWQSMLAMFRRNAMHVLRVSGTPTESYFEAQYVMAAFADEVFIHMDWEGQRTWTTNLLESTLFHSHVAGDLFFQKLDRLLNDRNPADKSLAAVYLSALSLGFRGKYHGVNDRGRLRRYRQDLFGFIFQHPTDLANESRIAFPDAYVQNLRSEKKKLTNPKIWLGVLGLVLLSYLAVSHGIWLSLTSRLDEANKKVVEIENRLTPNSVKR